MKTVVSVSIGSSLRNHRVETKILDEKYIIERIGTDGDIDKAIQLIKELDGKVDAFGLGGIDLYLTGANRKFMLKEAIPIVQAASKTPIVDGSGLKNTLEKKVVEYLEKEKIVSMRDKKVLMVCAADRYRMAEAFIHYGCDTILGDLIFALGIPVPIKSLKAFKRVVNILLPVVSLLPFKMLYPTGEKQHSNNSNKKFEKYYNCADIIAGDYLYIKKHMPLFMHGKIVITNTVTKEDIDVLKSKGVRLLITSTPEFDGRSFGTNVMEAVLVAASGKRPEELDTKDYLNLIKKMNWTPRIEYLNCMEQKEGKAQ